MKQQLERIMNNKDVLFVPVYSARSYKTGAYDLAVDGNMSRVLMKVLKSQANHIDIFVPDNCENIRLIEDILLRNKKDSSVYLLPVKYGKNAHETRNMANQFYGYINHQIARRRYDLIIVEIDSLMYALSRGYLKLPVENKKLEIIYWTNIWLPGGEMWNKADPDYIITIAEKYKTACIIKEQVDLYKGKSFYDEYVYYPEYFEKKTIFFPFRLSDKDYHAAEFADAIKMLLEEGVNNFEVLFTDPNDSGYFDGFDEGIFIKVPPTKAVYNAILKGKPVIPYFSDINQNSHSNIFDFLYYGCDIITFENNICKGHDNVTFIKDLQEFSEELKRRIENHV